MATGSLLGKADVTLVNAAEKQATANVPSDLGEIYKGEMETADLFQTEINTFFDTLYEEHNKLSDDLNASVATITENLSAGVEPNDAQIDLYVDYLDELREKHKNTPKGKAGERERQKIRSEMNRLKNSTDQMDGTITDLTTRINNNDYIPNATGSNNMKLLTAISNGSAKQEIVNGNLVYTLPGTDLRITQGDLKKMLVSNDPAANENFNKVHQYTGDQSDVDWATDRQGVVNNYENSFNTRESYAQNIHQKQGNMSHTFAEILQGKGDSEMNLQIFETLKELGVEVPEDTSGPDGKPDGKITEADFATPENGIALIRSLTDITDPNFNFQAAKKIAAEFYTDNIAAKEFEDAGGVIGGGKDMSDFDKAFAKARKDGLETFMYNGKEYGTELAQDDGTGTGTGTDDKSVPVGSEVTTGLTIGRKIIDLSKEEAVDFQNAIAKTSDGTATDPMEFTFTKGDRSVTYAWTSETGWTEDGKQIPKSEGKHEGMPGYYKEGGPEALVNALGWENMNEFKGYTDYVSPETINQQTQLIADVITKVEGGNYYGNYTYYTSGRGESTTSGKTWSGKIDGYKIGDILKDDKNPNRDAKGTTQTNMEIAAGNQISADNMRSRTNVSKALVSAWTSESDFFAFSRKGSDKFDFKLDPRRINRKYGQGFVNFLNTEAGKEYKWLLNDSLTTSQGMPDGYFDGMSAGGGGGIKWSYKNGGTKYSMDMMVGLQNKIMKDIADAFALYQGQGPKLDTKGKNYAN
jgi:hypothetical protein